MDNTISKLLSFFLDKSKSFGVKTGLIIVIIGILFFADYGLNLSYNISINNKISQLERIQNLKKSYANDSINLDIILELENEIITKKHYSEYLSFTKSSTLVEDSSKVYIYTNTTESNSTKVSTFWMVISSNFFFILVIPILIFLPLFPNQKFDRKTIPGWIALNLIWLGLIATITIISYQIPIIDKNPKYNYWLNFLIHIIFMAILILASKKKQT